MNREVPELLEEAFSLLSEARAALAKSLPENREGQVEATKEEQESERKKRLRLGQVELKLDQGSLYPARNLPQ
jgi:hypothetical protein